MRNLKAEMLCRCGGNQVSQNLVRKRIHLLKKQCKYLSVTCAIRCENKVRINLANIQMLSPGMHKQIFKDEFNELDTPISEKVQEHLKKHDLHDKKPSVLKNINFRLPPLHGNNIKEHFDVIVKDQFKKYFGLAESIASISLDIPKRPSSWLMKKGWTKYFNDGRMKAVSQPDDSCLVFDVEVCLNAGNLPVIAAAVSKDAWYCWVSDYIIDADKEVPKDIMPKHLIPFDTVSKMEERLLIGHNVSFDRSFLASQYKMKCNKTRFLDTLSLHMCVSGVTNEQRNYMNSKNPILYDWMEVGTTNSLAKLYEFYCGKELDKSARDLFVEGTLKDIKDNFQECVDYCSKDVMSTLEVLQILWPMFLDHARDPITFMGMLEMGTAYLPINSSWKDYITRSESMYQKVTDELKKSLLQAAEDTLKLMIGKKYEHDPWLWSLDWSLHKTVEKDMVVEDAQDVSDIHHYVETTIQHLSEKRKKQLHLPGYPKWYRDLCMRESDPNYKAGPVGISSQTKVTPLLLRMAWDGYPLHYERKYGWGYLKPDDQIKVRAQIQKNKTFPYREYLEAVGRNKTPKTNRSDASKINLMGEIYSDSPSRKSGIEIGVPGVRFFKLPHKDGEGSNVGNPLSKDFLGKIEDGTLSAVGDYSAKQPIELNKMLSFWRNGRKRIMSQFTVWFDEDKNDEKFKFGAILPQIITAGTVTRRAVEPTWLTASNPMADRIGSELKSMVRPPPGYCLIGADVDSQELWIASLLGDSQFSGIHGSTALSWMTLQGKKTDRTDLHSRTAETIGMSRDEAKIFNYGRIYGAGERFAVRLLMQFNHQFTQRQAEEKATKLYQSTKGVRSLYPLTYYGKTVAEKLGIEVPDSRMVTYYTMKRILNEGGFSWRTRNRVIETRKRWQGGSESEMFNKLESIALSDEPRTPVLNCLITKALQAKYVQNHYKTSRVNWVVQSSAVDYLHLMLVCMAWLIRKYDIDARFCISIHDEVRYIVREKDKYRAALALQITNLLTRSLFAYKLQMFDLPQSVAFFSSVDIDRVLRKEVDMDCKTPSNPYGLEKEYNIPKGESLDIHSLLERTAGRLER